MVNQITAEKTLTPERSFFQQIYSWMSLALFITGVTSFFVTSSPALLRLFIGNPMILFGLIILELIAVASLASSAHKMTFNSAMSLFIGYSILNGITLSGLMIIYTRSSVFLAFFITAATFIFMSQYAIRTKSDLTELGKLSFMGLIGIVIASIVNIFLRSTAIYWIISYIGVAVFIGLIAYDTQKLKQLYQYSNTSDTRKLALIGALTLYLDFINLFIMILRIIGGRRSSDF